MTSPTAQLTVARTLSEDVGLRQIILSLDGAPWTALNHGQQATRDLLPGTHTLKADNTLVRKSATFTVSSGEEARFAVANREGFGSTLLMLLGAPILYLTLVRETGSADASN